MPSCANSDALQCYDARLNIMSTPQDTGFSIDSAEHSLINRSQLLSEACDACDQHVPEVVECALSIREPALASQSLQPLHALLPVHACMHNTPSLLSRLLVSAARALAGSLAGP